MFNSPMFKVNARDIAHGILVSVGAAVLDTVVQAMKVPGFSFYQFDWKMLANVALIAGVSYLGKKLLTDEQGNFAGIKSIHSASSN